MKAKIRASFLTLALSCSAIGQAHGQEAEETLVYAPGTISCASYLSQHRRDVEIYVLGYWSGLNVKNQQNHMVGDTSDAAGIVAEVRLVCEQEPSLPVFGAINRVYWRMDEERR